MKRIKCGWMCITTYIVYMIAAALLLSVVVLSLSLFASKVHGGECWNSNMASLDAWVCAQVEAAKVEKQIQAEEKEREEKEDGRRNPKERTEQRNRFPEQPTK